VRPDPHDGLGDRLAVDLETRVSTLVDGGSEAEALAFGSVTLAEPEERELTLRAREVALERGARVWFDPNIRPNRWGAIRCARSRSRAG
jgi:sugar/nucleoside kinase (ribokinase family)